MLAGAAAVGVAGLPPPVPSPPRVTLRARAGMLRRPEIVAVLPVTVAAQTAAFAVYLYLGAVFVDAGGLALLVSVFGVAAALGGWLGGHGTDRWGAVPVLTAILVVFTVNHFLLAFWRDTTATGVLYMAVWGLTGWGTVPAQQHRLVRAAGTADAGIALSFNASALYLGIGLGSLLGGWTLRTAGPELLWLPAGISGALTLLLLQISAVAERRAHADRAQSAPELGWAAPTPRSPTRRAKANRSGSG